MSEFACVGCGRHIFRAIDLAPDEVCGMCLTLGAQRSKMFQDMQDGKIPEADFLRAFDGPPPTYICPHCGMASWNKNDAAHGWCGACRRYKVEEQPA